MNFLVIMNEKDEVRLKPMKKKNNFLKRQYNFFVGKMIYVKEIIISLNLLDRSNEGKFFFSLFINWMKCYNQTTQTMFGIIKY